MAPASVTERRAAAANGVIPAEAAIPAARARRAVLVPLALLAASVAVWALSLHRLAPDEITDVGLVSVLPAGFFAALALLTASFCLCLAAPRLPRTLLFLHVAALVLVLYGTPLIIEEVPRFAVTWRHLGITDYVVQHGNVDPKIDAYFNWPGFFFLTALIQQLGGVHDLQGVVRWAPLFFEALYLAPLLVIFRTFTRDARLVWLGIWLFYATNWIGQDYFSPQAASLFEMLVIVAILVRWFPGAGMKAQITGARRAGLMFALIAIFAAMVPSHQLTPFVLLAMTIALVVFRRSDARGLPTLMAVIIAAWITFMTVAYLSGHIGKLTGGVGNVSQSVGANVNQRVKGSTEHLLVIYVRLALSGAIWGLAALGFLRLWRRGQRAYTLGLLGIAPFGLLPLQPYGGELLLRIFLFSLPFMAFLAAAAFFPAPNRVPRWMVPGAATVVCVGLLGAFMVARYGNERMDAFTKREITAMDRLYAVAPPESVIMAAGSNTAWKYIHYKDYKYKSLTSEPGWKRVDALRAPLPVLANAVADQMAVDAGKHKRAYFIITKRQEAGADLLGLAPRGSLHRVGRALKASPRLRLLYGNRDARVYELRRSAKGTPRS